MKLRLRSILFRTCVNTSLALILLSSRIKIIPPMKMNWLKKSLLKERKSSQNSNKWLKNTMSNGNPKIENYTRFLGRYQNSLKIKFEKIEDEYYTIVDELIEKLDDLEPAEKWKEPPEFELGQLRIIQDWESGLASSNDVLDMLEGWDLEETARLHMTLKLRNYMFRNEEFTEYLKPVIAEVNAKVAPLYLGYLKNLKTFFTRATECDMAQIDLTWLEVVVGKETKTSIAEMTLNQTVRQLTTFVWRYVDSSFFLGDHIICLNEGPDEKNVHRSHWVFGPKAYIDMLKEIFEINDSLDIQDDIVYIKRLIGPYLNVD